MKMKTTIGLIIAVMVWSLTGFCAKKKWEYKIDYMDSIVYVSAYDGGCVMVYLKANADQVMTVFNDKGTLLFEKEMGHDSPVILSADKTNIVYADKMGDDPKYYQIIKGKEQEVKDTDVDGDVVSYYLPSESTQIISQWSDKKGFYLCKMDVNKNSTYFIRYTYR